jgi:lipoprotein-releasing system permease protein
MLYLAFQHLIHRRKQTLFTFLGVFFAATAYVVIAGFFIGFQEYLVDQLVNNDAHIRISAREDIIQSNDYDKFFFPTADRVVWISSPGGKKTNSKINDPIGWMQRLSKDENIEAFSPQMTAQVLVSRAQTSVSGRLIGSDVYKQIRVTNIAQFMTQGKFLDIAGGGQKLIMGDEMLAKLGGKVSETILLSNGKAAPQPFKVVGSFHTGIRTLDEGVAFAALPDVQKINQTPSQVNEIAIRLRDVGKAKELSQTWSRLSEERIQSWDEINANVLNVFKIQTATRMLMTFVIVLVSGFGVYNILNMVVTQKRKDIAILRSMGFNQKEVLWLFLSQGLFLGLVGGLLGIGVGFLVCLYLQTIPFGGGPLGTGAGYLTISFQPTIYVYGLLVGLVSATFASYMPARQAGRLTPIEIFRAGTD